ncbi:MAG: penicillin acylase family protein, partial [Candidatus Krumholzibacteriia bacterium]
KATPRDMLRIQLDDRALVLERWRDLLLAVLTPEVTRSDPRRAELRRHVESWGGRAAAESVGYRVVREFRSAVSSAVLGAALSRCRDADPRLRHWHLRQREGPVWQILQERPEHLLDPRHESWDEQLVAAVDTTLLRLLRIGDDLAERTWGERNATRIRHPISRAVPALRRWLDMPRRALPGDRDMPRVQAPTFGPSQRLVVSPGREELGFFHMPCGQSGHPMSPFYRNSHAAWENGEPTPFLPGPALHTLVLSPSDR